MVAGVATIPATNRPLPARRRAQSGRWLAWLLAAGLLVAGWRLLPLQPGLRQTLETLRGLGPWGPVLFILLYAVAAVLLVPGSVLTLGAGAVFGVLWGSVYASIAATLGATAAFLVGRHGAREWVARRLEDHPRFAAIDQAVAREGWKIVGLLRLSPVFPYTLLNYAFGLTRVKLGHYVLASWVGMLPGTLLYVYLGSLAGEAAGGGWQTSAGRIFYAGGGVATLLVTAVLTRIARRALVRRLPSGGMRP